LASPTSLSPTFILKGELAMCLPRRFTDTVCSPTSRGVNEIPAQQHGNQASAVKMASHIHCQWDGLSIKWVCSPSSDDVLTSLFSNRYHTTHTKPGAVAPFLTTLQG
jgi:hypothetical protein